MQRLGRRSRPRLATKGARREVALLNLRLRGKHVNTAIVQTLIDLPLDLLISDDNVRRTINEASIRELADSIKATGLAQPILVRPTGKVKSGQQKFQLITGHRRLAAMRILRGAAIAAIIPKIS